MRDARNQGVDKVRAVGFICSNCSLSAADTAGAMRLQYPADIRLVRVECSGQVDETLIAETFEKGADGVIVFGCAEGDCHYEVGNELTKERIEKMKLLLPAVGLEPQRLKFVQVAASEGKKFAQAIDEMFADLEKLGPSPIK